MKVRGYSYTINNYTETDVNQVLALSKLSSYTVYSYEIGETGTPHIQGYSYFKNPRSFNTIKEALPRAHIEVSEGTQAENKIYCIGPYSKDGKSKPYNPNHQEIGEISGQGKRNDLNEIRTLLQEGKGMKDVVEIATSYQSVKMAEQILKYHEVKRRWKPKVYWFYGATGCGKTETAWEMFPNAYESMATGKWWEGYDAHEDVIIDDMRGDFCKFHELLRLLDKYPYRVESKGTSRQFLARNIVITTCFHPSKIFETREDVGQLIRRIDEIREFKKLELNIL